MEESPLAAINQKQIAEVMGETPHDLLAQRHANQQVVQPLWLESDAQARAHTEDADEGVVSLHRLPHAAIGCGNVAGVFAYRLQDLACGIRRFLSNSVQQVVQGQGVACGTLNQELMDLSS